MEHSQKKELRTAIISFVITPSDKKLIMAEAEKMRMSLSNFIYSSMIQQIKEEGN